MYAGKRAKLQAKAKVQAGDAAQAQCFRDLLLQELETVAENLAACRVRLSNRLEKGEVSATARIRQEVVAREQQQRELEDLIAAIDLRFADHWAVNLTA